MAKFLKLPDGRKLEFIEYIKTNSVIIKLFNTDLSVINDFFGVQYIPYLYIVDDNDVVTETMILNMKMTNATFEYGSYTSYSYTILNEAYYTEDPVINQETGAQITDEHGNPIIITNFHPAEIKKNEEVKTGTIATVYLEKAKIIEQLDSINTTLGINQNVENMSLDDFKIYRVKESKNILEEYLLKNPLISSCHNQTEGVYSITLEKQNLMLLNYTTYQLLKNTDPDNAILTWNETGKECEPWAENEFIQLIFEVQNVIKPLVSAQQVIESEILSCGSFNDVLLVDIDYASYDIRNIEEAAV